MTEDELFLAAHYDLGCRLSDLVAASLTYQRDRRAHDRCLAEVADSEAVATTARRLAARLPSGLRLLELAESQAARCHRDLARAAERLRASAEAFVETAGNAAADSVAAMEQHNWGIDRSTLLRALRDRAGLNAAP